MREIYKKTLQHDVKSYQKSQKVTENFGVSAGLVEDHEEGVREKLCQLHLGQCYKTFFVRNLHIFVISKGVC